MYHQIISEERLSYNLLSQLALKVANNNNAIPMIMFLTHNLIYSFFVNDQYNIIKYTHTINMNINLVIKSCIVCSDVN